MEPSPRALAGRNGDAQCLTASVSESGYEGRWSVECLKRTYVSSLQNPDICT